MIVGSRKGSEVIRIIPWLLLGLFLTPVAAFASEALVTATFTRLNIDEDTSILSRLVFHLGEDLSEGSKVHASFGKERLTRFTTYSAGRNTGFGKEYDADIGLMHDAFLLGVDYQQDLLGLFNVILGLNFKHGAVKTDIGTEMLTGSDWVPDPQNLRPWDKGVTIGALTRTDLRLAINNQWRISSWSLGCDWLGLNIPIHKNLHIKKSVEQEFASIASFSELKRKILGLNVEMLTVRLGYDF